MLQLVNGFIDDVETGDETSESELKEIVLDVLNEVAEGDDGRLKSLEILLAPILLELFKAFLERCGEKRLRAGLGRTKRSSRRRGKIEGRLERWLKQNDELAPDAPALSRAMVSVGQRIDADGWAAIAG